MFISPERKGPQRHFPVIKTEISFTDHIYFNFKSSWQTAFHSSLTFGLLKCLKLTLLKKKHPYPPLDPLSLSLWRQNSALTYSLKHKTCSQSSQVK